jgi:hypothetical protein
VETTARETTPLQFGRPVEGSDGEVGRLTDVVVEPNERRVTHLVVEDPAGKARLVPAELLVRGREPDGPVVLSCSSADIAACASIRSFSYVDFGGEPPSKSDGTDVGVEDVLVMPSFGALGFGDYTGDFGGSYGVTYDSIPTGSAELRRDSLVVSESQEMLGTVDGLLVDGERLTHVVMQRAHAKDRTGVAIPVDSVIALDTDCVTVAPPTDGSDWRPASGI